MKNTGKKLNNAKDKVVGEIKEATGKLTGNEQLELKGKIQSTKADIKMKVNDAKEDIAKTINHTMNKKGKK